MSGGGIKAAEQPEQPDDKAAEPSPEDEGPTIIDGIELGEPHTFPFIAAQIAGNEGLSAKFRERPDAAFPPDPRWDTFQAQLHEHEAALPPVTDGIVSFAAGSERADDTVVESLLAALGRDGAVVLTGLTDAAPQIAADMAPYLDKLPADSDYTRRAGAVLARSAAAHDLASSPVIMRLCDAVIGRQVLRMDAPSCERLTRSTPGSSTRESATVLGASNPANWEPEPEEEEAAEGEGDADAQAKADAEGEGKVEVDKKASVKVEMPKMGKEEGEDGPMDIPAEGDKQEGEEEAPPPSATDNLSRVRSVYFISRSACTL